MPCICEDPGLVRTVAALERSITNLNSKVDRIYAAVKKSRHMAISTSSASPSSQSSDAEGYVKLEGNAKEAVDDPKYISVSKYIPQGSCRHHPNHTPIESRAVASYSIEKAVAPQGRIRPDSFEPLATLLAS